MQPFDPSLLQRVLPAAQTDRSPVPATAPVAQGAPAQPEPQQTLPRVPTEQPATPAHQGQTQGLAFPQVGQPGRSAAQERQTSLEEQGSRISRIHNPVLRTLAQIGDVAAGTFAPRAEQLIPGTEGNYALHLARAGNAVRGEQEQAKDQSEAKEREARGNLANAQADALQEESRKNVITLGANQGAFDVKNGKWLVEPTVTAEEKTTEIDPEFGKQLHIQPTKDGRYLVPNQALGALLKPKSETAPKTLVEKAIQDNPNASVTDLQKMLGNAGTKTEVKQLEVGGKPHQVLINSETGDTIKDLGESGEKPPTINVNAEQKPGKALLDKAESTYRTAQQSANDLRNFISMANSGNKVTAQAIPLEGTLAIVTSQGVKRINRTEVEQNQAAGSLFDRIMGEVGKLGSGQPVPPNILKDWNALADMMEKTSYSTYRSAHDSAVKRYKLNDEEPLPEPRGSGGGSAGGKAAEGGYQVGHKYGGMEYLGGPVGDQSNWKK